MKKKIRQNLSSILFWSVISAAFIGPGTLTTAASAGSGFRYSLIWVLMLSTVLCVILQVSVARVSIERDRSLGELLLERFSRMPFIPIALGLSVVFGCAAYQAGNLLGAALGLGMIFNFETRWIVATIVALASILLWLQSTQFIARTLGIFVALMGIIFVVIAISIDIDIGDIVNAIFVPGMPAGSEVLIMGLIGTTIVPYNLFLGSGISKGQQISSSRIGLIVAISVGGAISIAILLTGTLVSAPFDFEKMSRLLDEKLGLWSVYFLSIGLFSAGFTSSLTAPMAAVLTLRGIFPNSKGLKHHSGLAYKSVWMSVMTFGLLFGFLNVKPIPAIIIAQAANGIILPFIVVFLYSIIVKDKSTHGARWRITRAVTLSIVVFMVVSLGAFNLLKLLYPAQTFTLILAFAVGFVVVAALRFRTFLGKKSADTDAPER